ncbi:TonB-dependent receptor [Siphonobacter aquaeclarae]|uniref:Iron complex outermembrane recepter protein n=1 Tax=Siphonobacter aquaeclarae TaxID=563176 RepID=A0A1G9K2Q5_9BACT|nr:TonB-dependent receptor [Siphonobacter aquaeclarae]SDL43694.1 iron complex outermembrane recepter protein [Siphonobacter aquaeclarae]
MHSSLHSRNRSVPAGTSWLELCDTFSLLRILCLAGLILLAGARPVRAQGSVLDRRISLEVNQVTVSEVLHSFEIQAGVTFVFSNSLLDTQRKVTLRYDKKTLSEALKDLLGDVARGVQVQGNRIFIKPVKGESRGTVTGSVRTSDGHPAPFVDVSVRGTGRGTLTDENGNYQIKNVPAGIRQLIIQLVGYTPLEQTVEIPENQTVSLDPISLREDSRTLQEVVVTANNQSFTRAESEFVAKMPLKNLENPQVYTSVTGELLREQLVVTYSDALRNVPGVVMQLENNSAGGSVTSRGFPTQSFLRNGVPGSIGSGTIDPANIETIEAIKGPSGSLYGSSLVSFGGLFNRVTKKPFASSRSEITYTAGGFGLSRLSADINTPLNPEKTLLLRVNAARHHERSFQDAGFKTYSFVSPVLVYKLSDRTTASLEAEYRSEKSNSFYRLFADGALTTGARSPKDLKLDFNRRFYGDDIVANSGNANVYLQLDHRFSDRWQSRTNVTYLSGTLNGMSGYMSMKAGNDSLIRYLGYTEYQNIAATDLQQNFTGDFRIGSLRSRLLAGLEYYTSTTKSSAAPTIPFDIISASTPGRAYTALNRLAALDRFSTLTFTKGSARQNTYSAYVQEVLNVTPQLALLASLRLDYFDNLGTQNLTLGTTAGKYTQTAFSPKLGFTYQVIPEQVSVFGNYLNGFQNIAPLTQPDGTISTFKPSQANQWEAGVKFDAFQSRLSGSLSYYAIQVTDVTRADYPDRPAFTVQDGNQYSRGIEAQVVAQPVPGLSLIAGYAYNNSKYQKINATLDGLRPSNAGPEHTVNFWLSYGIRKGIWRGFGIGFGGNYAGENAVILSTASRYTLPSYFVLGAGASYDHTRFRLNLKADNLTDQRYWVGWSTTIPQMPARVSASVTLKL